MWRMLDNPHEYLHIRTRIIYLSLETVEADSCYYEMALEKMIQWTAEEHSTGWRERCGKCKGLSEEQHL